MAAIFGPAGKADSFDTMGYKKTEQIPDYLLEFGLNAFEYQCGRGVRINEASTLKFRAKAEEKGITLSLHAPYYISLSSLEAEKRDASIGYILDSAKAADLMGADRIIVHSGSCSKITREEALALAMDTLKRAQAALDEANLGHIHICPETMGKVNQLGTLSEVLSLCTIDERMIPCIDFGHLNARTFGTIQGKADYEAILDELENTLGHERLVNFHSHFSKIEYTTKGGEKKHLTFEDMVYGPHYEPLMELIAKKGLSPRFICESAGTQSEDAKAMMEYYTALLAEK